VDRSFSSAPTNVYGGWCPVKAHFLPQCYLKGFVDRSSDIEGREPFVWVRKPGGVWAKKAPKNLAHRKDYYAVQDDQGNKNFSRESALADLEGKVAPILRRIPGNTSLSSDDKATILMFAATMHVRSPSVHDALEDLAVKPTLEKLIGDEWRKLRNDPEALRRSLEACARDTGDERILSLPAEAFDLEKYKIQVNRDFVVDRSFGVGHALLRMLAHFRWRLLVAPPGTSFIASDQPFHQVAVKDTNRATRYDLRNPEINITLPLTREVMLLGDRHGPPDITWAGIIPGGVGQLNAMRAGPALKLYCPSKSFPGLDQVEEFERAAEDTPAMEDDNVTSR
jgi:Protein of unknown function (DUF4238)